MDIRVKVIIKHLKKVVASSIKMIPLPMKIMERKLLEKAFKAKVSQA